MSEVGKKVEGIPRSEEILPLPIEDIRKLAKNLSPEDIKKLIKELPAEKAKEWEEFVSKKGFTRRRAVEIGIAAATTIGGLAVLYELLKKKGQKEEETTSEIEKTAAEIEKEFDIEKVSGIELFEKLAEYPEAIEKSDKQTLDQFVKYLSKEKFDNLIFGERYTSSKDKRNAAYVVEKLIENGLQISTIGFDFLSYGVKEDIEATKKFNEGKGSPDEMIRYVVGNEPLLRLARKYSIPIAGLEERGFNDKMIDVSRKNLPRFGKVSERVGEIAKEKKKAGIAGIVVTAMEGGHVTVDSWENDNLKYRFAKLGVYEPPKEEILEKNYTVKEYLEKIGLNPVAVIMEDWKSIADLVHSTLSRGFKEGWMSPKDIEEAYKIWNKRFSLKEKDDFIIKYPRGKENTFLMVMPGDAPEKLQNFYPQISKKN